MNQNPKMNKDKNLIYAHEVLLILSAVFLLVVATPNKSNNSERLSPVKVNLPASDQPSETLTTAELAPNILNAENFAMTVAEQITPLSEEETTALLSTDQLTENEKLLQLRAEPTPQVN